MSRDRGNQSVPKRGDVVYFIRLHLNSASKVCEKQHHKDKHFWYEIEGKARPMIVLSPEPRKSRGEKWYQVLILTTKGTKDAKRIGPILKSGEDSYGYHRLEWYPGNLICPDYPCEHLDREFMYNLNKLYAWTRS